MADTKAWQSQATNRRQPLNADPLGGNRLDRLSVEAVGWRYTIEEAPPEPENNPPEHRVRDRLEFFEQSAIFGSWEIPYSSITEAIVFAPNSLLQWLRLSTDSDVFEFLVARGKLPSELPFPVRRAPLSRDGEIGRGIRRMRFAIMSVAIGTTAALIWLLVRAGY